MKFLIFNFEYPPLGGGGGVATKQLAERMALKHEIHVITTKAKGLPKEEVLNGVYMHRVNVLSRKSFATASLLSMISFVPMAWWCGIRITGRIKFDVINAQFVVPSGIPAVMVAGWRKIPFVLSLIGGDLYDPTKGVSPHRHWSLRVLIGAIAKGADICTAISNDTKERAKRIHNIEKEIIVTHLGIEETKINKLSRNELGLPEDVPIFVSIGRLIPRKGYKTLIKAWSNVEKANLLILGSGPQEDELLALSKKAGVQDRIQLLGFVPEERKLQILDVVDGYVSATEHEGFGIVFLEAMNAGLPIVATNEGGHTDFLVENVNALLVGVGDEETLADAVNKIVNDSSVRENMARCNRNDVKRYYLDETVRKFEKVLVDVRRIATSPKLRGAGKNKD